LNAYSAYFKHYVGSKEVTPFALTTFSIAAVVGAQLLTRASGAADHLTNAADPHHRAHVFPFTLPAEVRDLQTAFFAARQRHAAEVERVERAAARAYWKAHPRHGIADKFFDDAGEESIPRRMARIYPGWW
jgi:hypothetical protein